MPEKILVDANALKQVLEALVGPHHLVLELQTIMRIPKELSQGDNPIAQLIEDYNKAIKT